MPPRRPAILSQQIQHPRLHCQQSTCTYLCPTSHPILPSSINPRLGAILDSFLVFLGELPTHSDFSRYSVIRNSLLDYPSYAHIRNIATSTLHTIIWKVCYPLKGSCAILTFGLRYQVPYVLRFPPYSVTCKSLPKYPSYASKTYNATHIKYYMFEGPLSSKTHAVRIEKCLRQHI